MKRYLLLIIAFTANASWAVDAIVVDDSDHYVQTEQSAGVVIANAHPNGASAEEEPLVKEEVSEGNKNNAKLIDKVVSLQQELQELRGQLEVQMHDIKLLQQQQASWYKDVESRLNAQVVQPLKPSKNNSLKPGVANKINTRLGHINPADEQISYLAAYELIKSKQFAKATVAMQDFYQKYPQGGYTANAAYWLGELHLLHKEYQKSITYFDIVLQQFSTSSKAAASLLKSAYAYSALGNKPEAKRRLKQITRNYPGTPTARLAQIKLDSI